MQAASSLQKNNLLFMHAYFIGDCRFRYLLDDIAAEDLRCNSNYFRNASFIQGTPSTAVFLLSCVVKLDTV